MIDFLVVLFGYARSFERRLPAFYQRLQPFADPFTAWFGRDRLPVRSTLSRDFSALTSEPVDTLRSLFLDDLRETARSRKKSKRVVWRIERETRGWSLISMARARQPESRALPPPFRRLDDVCAAFLHWAQARASGAYPHGQKLRSPLSMARLVWQSRERERAARNGARPLP